MKNKIVKSLLSITSLALMLPLVACDVFNSTPANETTYNIKVENLIGVAFENVTVSLKKNNNVVVSGDTDINGNVSLKAELDQYDIVVENQDLPVGYYCLDGTFKTDGVNTDYTLNITSEVISEEAPSNYFYSIGSIMHDFTFVNTEGKYLTLSNELYKKDMILINLWATWCNPCAYEFPFMEEAYQEYKDSVSIFALSYADSNASIRAYKREKGLSFDMGHDTSVIEHVPTDGIPTTLIVDRYGMITDIHIGALTSAAEFKEIFEKHIGDDYKPDVKLDTGNDDNKEEQEETRVKPNVSMPSSSEISSAICANGFETTFTGHQTDEYAWPFVLSEDGTCIEPSNGGYDNTYSIINFNINLEKDGVFAFDYKMSTEYAADILFVLVDGDILYELSGVDTDFDTCFAYVALKKGTYKITFVYQKDDSLAQGEDTAYIKNLRYLSLNDIDEVTYIKRPTITNTKLVGNKYSGYITPVLNENDNYYHVNDKNGPLILFDFFLGTYWDGTVSFYNVCIENDKIVSSNHKKIIDEYANYANNNTYRLTPVTPTLLASINFCLKTITSVEYAEQYLELCYYYDAYGPNATSFESPIKGLAPFDALEAQLGSNNFVTYDCPVLPRGKLCKFVPSESGAYQIRSLNETSITIAWLFDENRNILYESNDFTRQDAIEPKVNVDLYVYLEQGKTYFIDVAFGDYLELGTVQFELNYLGESASRLEKCSSPYFTTGLDENGEMDAENIISIGIEYKLGDDGYYHELKSNGELGSIIYTDFKYPTGIFNEDSLVNIAIKGGFMKGESFDEEGYNMTIEFASYIDSQLTDGEYEGLVPVDARLAELLQFLMDKQTFEGIEDSWLKLCYYNRAYEKLN